MPARPSRIRQQLRPGPRLLREWLTQPLPSILCNGPIALTVTSWRVMAARGEIIYYYKCWMCHNQYTKGAPYLKDLYQHSTMESGQPVGDDTVAAQIQNGGPGMPAFHTTLSDADVADVVAYIREGKCCVEGENPPKNPWYEAEEHKWPVQSTTSGGVHGTVKIPNGDIREGVMMQL